MHILGLIVADDMVEDDPDSKKALKLTSTPFLNFINAYLICALYIGAKIGAYRLAILLMIRDIVNPLIEQVFYNIQPCLNTVIIGRWSRFDVGDYRSIIDV